MSIFWTKDLSRNRFEWKPIKLSIPMMVLSFEYFLSSLAQILQLKETRSLEWQLNSFFESRFRSWRFFLNDRITLNDPLQQRWNSRNLRFRCRQRVGNSFFVFCFKSFDEDYLFLDLMQNSYIKTFFPINFCQ